MANIINPQRLILQLNDAFDWLGIWQFGLIIYGGLFAFFVIYRYVHTYVCK